MNLAFSRRRTMPRTARDGRAVDARAVGWNRRRRRAANEARRVGDRPRGAFGEKSL
jgi:hypothetical protein